MPVEADQFRQIQGNLHRRAEDASKGHIPGGRLRLHQARRGPGSDQRDVSAVLNKMIGGRSANCPAKVSTHVMFTRIPPAAAGGSFSLNLPRTGKIPRIPPAAAGGSFSPALCFPLLGAQVGIERSTGCRRWDSRVFLVSCRPGLNDPPAAAGGIHKARTCVETSAGQFALRLSIRSLYPKGPLQEAHSTKSLSYKLTPGIYNAVEKISVDINVF